MTTVVTVILITSPIIMPALITTIIPVLTMSFLITRDILTIVPVVMDKKDPLAAGIIFAAIPAPMFGMPRRNVQVDRRTVSPHPPLNNYRLTVEQSGLRVIADIKLAIEPRLAYTERDANVGSECRGGDGGSG